MSANLNSKQIEFVERQVFHMEPDCYAGKLCDELRPRWMTSYPKEGKEEDGETLKLDMPASMFPPGTRVTIEVPVCPKCGDPADMNGSDGKAHKNWPRCDCKFSWTKWVRDRFS